MTNKAILVVVSAVAALGIAAGVYAATGNTEHTGRTDHSSSEQGQVPAPPHPPRAKPLERVVVTSK